ncbi:hypothetical protein HG530_010860 [Fusarium avenaceum]|nr:hypothetical protein HG530_010860 [Fusarium avenaceum]
MSSFTCVTNVLLRRRKEWQDLVHNSLDINLLECVEKRLHSVNESGKIDAIQFLQQRLDDLEQTLNVNLVQDLDQRYCARYKCLRLVDELVTEKILSIVNKTYYSLDGLGRQQRLDSIDQALQVDIVQGIEQWDDLANKLDEVNLRECVEEWFDLLDEILEVDLSQGFKKSTEESLEVKLAEHLQEWANLVKQIFEVGLGQAVEKRCCLGNESLPAEICLVETVEQRRSLGDQRLGLGNEVFGEQILGIAQKTNDTLDRILGKEWLHGTQDILKFELADRLQKRRGEALEIKDFVCDTKSLRRERIQKTLEINLAQGHQQGTSIGDELLGVYHEILGEKVLGVAQKTNNTLHRFLGQQRGKRIKHTCKINLA